MLESQFQTLVCNPLSKDRAVFLPSSPAFPGVQALMPRTLLSSLTAGVWAVAGLPCEGTWCLNLLGFFCVVSPPSSVVGLCGAVSHPSLLTSRTSEGGWRLSPPLPLLPPAAPAPGGRLFTASRTLQGNSASEILGFFCKF